MLYLHSLAPTRKNVPDLLVNPVALIQDVRTLVEQHRKDQANMAITGVPIVRAQHLANARNKRPYLSLLTTSPIFSTKIKPTASPPTILHAPQPSTSSHPSFVVKTELNVIEKNKEDTGLKERLAVPLITESTSFLSKGSDESKLESDSELNPIRSISKFESPFPHLRDQLRQQQESAKRLKPSSSIVRPTNPGNSYIDPQIQRRKASGVLLGQLSDKMDLILRPEILLPMFRFLSIPDLLTCMRVCRSWNRYSIDPALWKLMDLSKRHLTPIILAGIIRRQPRSLVMDWSSFSHQQCAWLMDRLPHLTTLSMQGCSASVLGALKLPPVILPAFSRAPLPKLTVLDLSWVSGLNDILIESSILSSPPHRLSNLRQLALAGSQLTDSSLAGIASLFPALECLCLAYCLRFTPHGLRTLVFTHRGLLQRIDLMGCTQLLSFDYPTLLTELRLRNSRLCLPDDITGDSKPIHRCFRLN